MRNGPLRRPNVTEDDTWCDCMSTSFQIFNVCKPNYIVHLLTTAPPRPYPSSLSRLIPTRIPTPFLSIRYHPVFLVHRHSQPPRTTPLPFSVLTTAHLTPSTPLNRTALTFLIPPLSNQPTDKPTNHRTMTLVVRLRRALRHTKCHSSRKLFLFSLFASLSFFPLLLLFSPHNSFASSFSLDNVVRTATQLSHSSHSSNTDVDPNARQHIPPLPHDGHHNSVYEPLLSRVDAIVGEGHSAKKVLVDVYALPLIVVSNMTQHVATRLYWKLVYTDVVRALRIETDSSNNNSDGNRNVNENNNNGNIIANQVLQPRATVLFVHAQNGLGNRLRAIASGITLARSTHRVPVIVWQRDAHLGASLSDIFNEKNLGSDINSVLYRDLIVMEDFPSWELVNERSAYWQAFNYMQKDGLGAMTDQLMRFEPPTERMSLSQPPSGVASSAAIHAVLHAPPPPAKPAFDASLVRYHQHVYFKSGYIANVLPLSLVRRSDVNMELRALTPTAKVMGIVGKFDQNRLRHSYGIHIRSRTLANDNVAVDNDCEYTKSGAWTTDYWRSQSQLPVFIHKINQKLRLRRNATFFVAADDREVIKKLKELYPGRVDSIDRDCDDREAGCVVYAMADLLCLAKTRRLYGSNWSSFSEVAGRLTNRRLYLSGKDFGRAKRVPWWGMRNAKMLPLAAWKWWVNLGDPYSHCGSKRR